MRCVLARGLAIVGLALPAIAHSQVDVGSPGSCYKLSAVDVNGNESDYALVTPSGTTAVENQGRLAFALEGVRPNPASGDRLTVSFALLAAAPARLELWDVSGRRVMPREVDSLGAGRHVVDLEAGHSLAPGRHLLRLSQGTDQQSARVAVIH